VQIVIIGAGAMGSAIAQELVLRDDVEGVRIVDSHSRALQELADRLPGPKLRSFQMDARDRAAIAPVLEGASCVVGASTANIGLLLAGMALDHGCHYCDLGGPDAVLGEKLGLADRAREVGRWVVPGCGLAPGLVNVLCLHGIEQFESVHAARIRVGGLPLHPVEPFRFQLASSPDKLLEDYTLPARVIEEGAIATVDPLMGVESIDFGEPFGRLEAFHTAGGLSHLVERLLGRVRNLDLKSVQWPGHAGRMRFLLGLGLGEDRSIDVRTHLTYRDILVRRMRQRLAPAGPDVVLVRVAVQGTVDGRDRTLVFGVAEHAGPETGDSAMRRCTAVPAAAVAAILASGAIGGGGAAPPESVVPRTALLSTVRGRGIAISEQWFDGHVGVGDAASA
jgi:saccharopine dehydrogenase-like NADP-dependent oxidoreductase